MKEDIDGLIKDYIDYSNDNNFFLVYDKIEKDYNRLKKYNASIYFLNTIKELLSVMYNSNLMITYGYKKMVKFKVIFENLDKDSNNNDFMKRFEKLYIDN